jgi:SPW repeat
MTPAVEQDQVDRSERLPPPPPPGRRGAISASALNLLLGCWLIAAPWALHYKPSTPRWNDVLFGAVVAVIALARMFGAYRLGWLSLLNAAIGAWLVVSAVAIDAPGPALVNDLVCGALIAVYSLTSASVSDSLERPSGLAHTRPKTHRPRAPRVTTR